MGKHKPDYESFEGHRSGRIPGIRDILGYHCWHAVKKLFPNKWRYAPIVGDRHKHKNRNDKHSNEDRKLVKKKAAKTSLSKRMTGKSRIKALVAKEMANEDLGIDAQSFSFMHPQYNTIDSATKYEHVSRNHYAECAPVLDIFKVNRELFLQSLQKPGCGDEGPFHRMQSPNTKVRLTKSGSFPTLKSLSSRSCRSSSLEHKQKEIWTTTTKSMRSESDDRERNQVAVSHFEDVKQRLKRETKNKKENKCRTTEGRCEFDLQKEGTNRDDDSVCKFYTDRPRLMKRTTSLNESVGQYTELFERTCKKDRRLPLSKSLRLTNVDGFGSDKHAPMSHRRVMSLHDVDAYRPIQNEVCPEAGSEVDPTTTEKCASLDIFCEFDCQKDVTQGNGYSPDTVNETGSGRMNQELIEDMVEPDEGDRTSSKAHEINSRHNARTELIESAAVSLVNFCSQGDPIGPPGFPISEGLESNSSSCSTNELDSSVDIEAISTRYSTLDSCCSTADIVNVENAEKSKDMHRHHEADVNNVRDVLESSFFTENGHFAELETCLLYEPELSKDSTGASCNRKLLVDIVNEALLEIYERSSSYWPRALSFSCHVHPIPNAHHALEEVCTSKLSLRPKMEQSFDSVAQDLANGDGWMNLQFESENVGLEVEDLILSELLDEIICF